MAEQVPNSSHPEGEGGTQTLRVRVSTKGHTVELPARAPEPGDPWFLHGREEPSKYVAEGYCESRRLTDSAGSQLWRIHDKYFDLSEYLASHPGGRQWLERTRGWDITEAVQSHHLRLSWEQLYRTIRKYEVPAPQGLEGLPPNRFTFDEDGFYGALRQRAAAYLKQAGAPTGTPPASIVALNVGFVLLWASVAALAVYLASPLLAACAGFLLLSVWGVGHNFLHQGARRPGAPLRYVMGITGVCSSDFQVTHCLSHHLLPNTTLDIEVYAFKVAKLHWLPSERGNAVLVQRVLALVIFAMLIPTTFGQRVLGIVTGERRLGAEDLLLPGIVTAFALAAPTLATGLGLAFIMYAVFGVVISVIGLIVHHGADAEEGRLLAWHDGDGRPLPRDWAMFEIAAATDHSTGAGQFVSLLLFGNLNHHVAHHLWPAVDHSWHAELMREVIRPTCAEFGVEYVEYGALELLGAYFRHLVQRDWTVMS